MGSPEGLGRIREASGLPLIATDRRRDQGGSCSSPEEERVGRLLEACEVGFDYVDLELTTGSLEGVVKEVRALGVGLIISHHDLLGTPAPEALEGLVELERGLGADICKVVGTALKPEDNLAYLSLLHRMRGPRIVCFGMGRLGVFSRVFSPIIGGSFTYASASGGRETGPGQLSVADLMEVYRLMGV